MLFSFQGKQFLEAHVDKVFGLYRHYAVYDGGDELILPLYLTREQADDALIAFRKQHQTDDLSVEELPVAEPPRSDTYEI